MVVELSPIEVSSKGFKGMSLAIYSRTQAKLIRPYRARSGGSNGVLYICTQFMVVELMAIGKSGKGSKAIALAIRTRTQVNLVRPDRARRGSSNGILYI